MAKYRLSYLGYGGYKSIDLKKLECLSDRKVTDIQTLDEFTTSFKNMEELLLFLKRNKIIEREVNKLVITVDKKENEEIINKKIYRGENLLFENDKMFLDMSFIYKWIMNNLKKPELMIAIFDNYIEKYQNAYNRTTGASYILNLFKSLKTLAINIKRTSALKPSEINEYENTVKEFINFEFYKLDKDILTKKGKIERKVEKDGTYKKNYRNIHDFIILLKTIDKNLNKYSSFELSSQNSKILVIEDNFEEPEEKEEFLFESDILKANKEIVENYKENTDDEDNIIEGNDFFFKISKEELEETLYQSGMKLVKTPQKEDLK